MHRKILASLVQEPSCLSTESSLAEGLVDSFPKVKLRETFSLLSAALAWLILHIQGYFVILVSTPIHFPAPPSVSPVQPEPSLVQLSPRRWPQASHLWGPSQSLGLKAHQGQHMAEGQHSLHNGTCPQMPLGRRCARLAHSTQALVEGPWQWSRGNQAQRRQLQSKLGQGRPPSLHSLTYL